MEPDRLEKLRHYATGKVTTGYITQVIEKSLIRSYVGKVRGMVVSRTGENGDQVWKFATEGEARTHAVLWRESCRKELAEYEANQLAPAPTDTH